MRNHDDASPHTGQMTMRLSHRLSCLSFCSFPELADGGRALVAKMRRSRDLLDLSERERRAIRSAVLQIYEGRTDLDSQDDQGFPALIDQAADLLEKASEIGTPLSADDERTVERALDTLFRGGQTLTSAMLDSIENESDAYRAALGEQGSMAEGGSFDSTQPPDEIYERNDWYACASCGSGNRVEYAEGHAICAECAVPVTNGSPVEPGEVHSVGSPVSPGTEEVRTFKRGQKVVSFKEAGIPNSLPHILMEVVRVHPNGDIDVRFEGQDFDRIVYTNRPSSAFTNPYDPKEVFF